MYVYTDVYDSLTSHAYALCIDTYTGTLKLAAGWK